MNRSFKSILITILGIVFIGIGFLLLKEFESMASLPYPYVLIGIGVGTFGSGLSGIIEKSVYKNHPDIARQKEINLKDERNQAIGNRAKAKAYDCMVFVFGALMLCFSLMQSDLKVILLLVFAYLFVIGYGLFYRIKYDKEM